MDSAYPWKVYDLETQRNGGTNADDIIPILKDTNLDLIPIKELVYPRWADLPRIKELNPGLIVVHLSSFSSFSSFSTKENKQNTGTQNPPVYEVTAGRDNVDEFKYFLRNALEELPQTRFLIYSRLTQEQKETFEQVLQKELSASPKPDDEKRKHVMLFAVCPTNGRGNNPSKHSFRDPITRSVFRSYVRSLLGDLDTPQECPTEGFTHTGITTGDGLITN